MKSQFLFSAKSVFCKSLVVLSGLLFSQAANAQKITPIVTTGFGLSDWRLSEGSSLKTGMLPSLDLGLLMDININNSLSVVSGLQYSEVGAEIKFDETDSPSYSLGYISLPAFGKVRLSNGFSVYAGPKAGFLISAKEDNFDGDKYDVKDAFKKADFSLAGGINYKFSGGFEVGVNFTHGFLNIYKNGNTRIQNYGFGVNAAYNITMPKA
jgi:hypothetical protein